MASAAPKAGPRRVRKRSPAPTLAVPGEAMELNVYGNTNPDAQREVLDGLPVLVFLERAGKIVFANAEARQLLGMAERRVDSPSRRRRSVGTLSRHSRAANPADRHAARQPLPRHSSGPQRPPCACRGHLQHLERATARSRDRGSSQRKGASSQIAADGRCALQPSRSRRHRASESRSLHQSRVHAHVWLHR